MISRRGKGYEFENKAVAFLAPLGYRLISRNYTIRGGEIDLIFEFISDQDPGFGPGSEIVFVEVKGFDFATPFDKYSALHRKKLHSLRRAINKWLSIHDKQEAAWRLDFIIITKKGVSHKIEHFKNVDINSGNFSDDS